MMSRGTFAAQGRVIFALILREMSTRFGRAWAGYLWALAEPAGFIALLGILFSQIAHTPPHGESFALFYATGFLGFSIYHETSRVTSRAVEANRPLLTYPAVTPLDLVLARFLLQVLTSLVVSTVILTTIVSATGEEVRPDPIPLALALGLGSLLGLGIGMLNTVLFAWSRSFDLAFVLASRPLFLISGVFFSYHSMPEEVQGWLWWNPILHIVGLIREGLYPAYDGGHLNPAYVLTAALALILAGLTASRMAGRRLAEAR